MENCVEPIRAIKLSREIIVEEKFRDVKMYLAMACRGLQEITAMDMANGRPETRNCDVLIFKLMEMIRKVSEYIRKTGA